MKLADLRPPPKRLVYEVVSCRNDLKTCGEVALGDERSPLPGVWQLMRQAGVSPNSRQRNILARILEIVTVFLCELLHLGGTAIAMFIVHGEELAFREEGIHVRFHP
jgi:hypothetical protein